MATLLAIFVGKRCVARCDRNCYKRGSRRQHCACGGSNRARGHDAARLNTLTNWWHMVEDWKAEHRHVQVSKVIRPLPIIRIRRLKIAA